MEISTLTTEMMMAFSVLGMVIVLLVFDLLRVDIVGLLVITVLPLTGILTAKEAVAGLGSSAVMVLICVMVLGAALNKTGLVSKIAQKIVKLSGNSEPKAVTLLGLTVAIPSGLMSNVGATALLLPAALQVARQSGIAASRLVMPLGFCAMMGGSLTLVGSTPLIILNSVMENWWQKNPPASGDSYTALGLFSITPIGIAMLLGTLAYFLLIGGRLLPTRVGKEKGGTVSAKLRELYGEEVGRGVECVVPDDFTEQTLGKLDVRSRYRCSVLAVASKKGHEKIHAPLSTTSVGPGDVVFMACREDSLQNIVRDLGWQPRASYETFAEDASPEKSGVLEAIVSSRSALNGHSMNEFKLKELFSINPLAVIRGQKIHIKELAGIVLKPGDSILLQGKWDHLRNLREKTDLVYTENPRGEEVREKKAWLALTALAAFLVLALGVKLPLSAAGMVAMMIIVLGKVLHIDEVYQAIEWKTIFLVAGLIPLGVAFEKAGAANYMAMTILNIFDTLTPLFLYLILAVLTSFMAMFVSNVGTTVMLVPLAMGMAVQVGADPKIAGLVVAISSINTFALPTHQVNALIMQPGGYKTSDYMRVGSGMMVLFLVILMMMLKFFY